MNLLAVRLARTIFLVPPYFLNPKGKFIRPSLEALKTRYGFQKSPFDAPASIPSSNEGAKYENGFFNSKNGSVVITSLTIHNDGFVVDGRTSTDDCEAFAMDVLTWISKEHGLPDPNEVPISRLYASELNVSYERAPALLNPKLNRFFSDVSAAIADERTGQADFLSFQFSTDPTKSPRQATFRLDREINVPFDQNRYYSYASTKTDTHIELLRLLGDTH